MKINKKTIIVVIASLIVVGVCIVIFTLTQNISIDSNYGNNLNNSTEDEIIDKGSDIPTISDEVEKEENSEDTDIISDNENVSEINDKSDQSNNENQNDVSNKNDSNNQLKEEKGPNAPTLSNPAGGLGERGEKVAELTITYAGEYANSTANIFGFELYEKNGNQYTLIYSSETVFKKDVTVDVGESKTYVARVYSYNKSNKKIYSNYSNEIVISA